MKSKSALIFVAGVTVGTVAGLLMAPRKNYKSRKELWKKSRKHNKAFKEIASKYREKLKDVK